MQKNNSSSCQKYHSHKKQCTAYVVAGLHYGDEGKGTTVEYLARHKNACAVIRYGGGPQAAHHVVLEDGTWHCFSHFTSAMFIQDTLSILSRYMLIYPQTLVPEADELKKKKVSDCVSRLKIDCDCFVITPYHQLVGRVLQILRSNSKGSTGLGVGQAVEEVYASHPEYFPKRLPSRIVRNFTTLQAKDLLDSSKRMEKLSKIYKQKVDYIASLLKMDEQGLRECLFSVQERQEAKKTTEPILTSQKKKLVIQQLLSFTSKDSRHSLPNCLAFYQRFVQEYSKCFVDTTSLINQLAGESTTLIFEGSQGALLDPVYGFFPHVTRTLCTADNVYEILRNVNTPIKLVKVGVLRCYSHRHGAGPFVTEDPRLAETVTELHNKTGRWQGSFRVGVLDLVALQYGTQIFEPDYLSVTCLDRLGQLPANRVCIAYKKAGIPQTPNEHISRILKQNEQNHLEKTDILCILNNCSPVCQEIANIQLPKHKYKHKYSALTNTNNQTAIDTVSHYLRLIEQTTGVRIGLVSFSPVQAGKSILLDF